MNPTAFLVLNLALAFYNVGTIWAHEVDIFRSWKLVEPATFHRVQRAHWRKLPYWVLAPFGLTLIGAIALMWYRPANTPPWMAWSALVAQLAAHLLTLTLWARWQARLSRDELGSRSPYLTKILSTHWIRTLLVNAYALILLLWVLQLPPFDEARRMRVRIPFLAAATALLATSASAPADAPASAVLGILVTGLRSSEGQVGCSLYTAANAKSFPTDSTAASQRQWCPVAGGQSACAFAPIPAGIYAVACFHDENKNGKLDTGLFGIPTEGTVVSNQAKGFLGPPSFEHAKFSFAGTPARLQLRMGY